MTTARALATVALGLVLTGCGQGDGPASDAPEGTRWVGSGRVVVAVPDWWTTGETQCLEPVEDTVYFDSGALTDCADEPAPSEVRAASTLAVLESGHGYGEHLLTRMEPAGEVDGREVLELDGCDGWFPGVCRRVLAVPSEGVVLAITVADAADGDYDEIRDSLRVLPEGQTTVPLDVDGWTPTWGAEPRAAHALVRTLERAGLRVEVVEVEPSARDDAGSGTTLPSGSLLDVEPALGSVIDEGGTVTVSVLA
ncbi:hypothetical protein [Nocardioides sp. YIM 152315]|uniref:hypothetical protein n=1 Tax=Nocardioides sp. YIM 152315 TaxID=3031760 RepID=UPI0023DA433F|nr:hypothetical protein [Nocardioides sp. YIM 152315]MDF1604825.1 hypothetical protein [Nocardioides sp. YIM 152315]